MNKTLNNACILATKGLGPSRKGDRKEMCRNRRRKWEMMDTVRGDGFIKEELANSSNCCGLFKLEKKRL